MVKSCQTIPQQIKALKRGLEGGSYLDFPVFVIGFAGNSFPSETITREAKAVTLDNSLHSAPRRPEESSVPTSL